MVGRSLHDVRLASANYSYLWICSHHRAEARRRHSVNLNEVAPMNRIRLSRPNVNGSGRVLDKQDILLRLIVGHGCDQVYRKGLRRLIPWKLMDGLRRGQHRRISVCRRIV
jgi:hypothetical protein